MTQVGTPVIIAGEVTDPASVKDPGPILGSSAKEEIDAKAGKKAASPAGSNAVTSILVSRADNRIYVLQGGAIVAEGDANIRTRRSRSAPTCLSGKAATRTARPGTEWASTPMRRGRQRRIRQCSSGSKALRK